MARNSKSRTGRCLRLERLEARVLFNATLRGGVWRISGGRDADDIVIEPDAADPTLLCAVVNGETVDTRPWRDITKIRINGGPGDDKVRIELPSGSVIATRLLGGRGDDLLEGGSGVDVVRGGGGADTLRGNDGADDLKGGSGNDLIEGGNGDDLIRGGGGSDLLYGNGGVDRLMGGGGANWLYGLATEDLLRVRKRDALMGAEDAGGMQQLDDAGALHAWFIEAAAQQWQGTFGGLYGGGGIDWYHTGLLPPLVSAMGGSAREDAPMAVMTADAGNDYSGTNTQEEDVDEADIIKTDGEFLYVISGDELLIVDAWPATDLGVTSRVEIEGTPSQLYLHDDRVMVISYVQDNPPWHILPVEPVGDRLMVTLGMPFRPDWVWRSQLKVTLLDVSDAAAPEVVAETYLDGSLVDSRATEDRAFIVMRNYFALPEPQPWADGTRYETESEFRARLEASPFDVEMPQWVTIDSDGNEVSGALMSPPDIFIPERPIGQDVLSVVAFDFDADADVAPVTTSVLGVSGEVYASAESLYVTATSWANTMDWWQGERMSQVYKFDLTAEDVPLVATGSVPGWVLNQFSMDEEDGFLRMATSTTARGALTSNVFVLGQRADTLSIVGSVTGIAPGEQMRSARFMGDEGFLVTFRQVDPLFTLDLSDPTHPAVVGELKVPGYSSYLHPAWEDYLLGLGRDVDPVTNRVQGVQLSLFDVSDLSAPVQVDVYQFSAGSGWSASDAEWDPHAFSFFPGYDIVALPVQHYGSGRYDSGLQVLRVDPDAGLTFLGEIEHEGSVRRSLRIENLLYSVSSSEIKVHVIDDPGQEVGSLRIVPVDGGGSGPLSL